MAFGHPAGLDNEQHAKRDVPQRHSRGRRAATDTENAVDGGLLVSRDIRTKRQDMRDTHEESRRNQNVGRRVSL
jgi:hypothetical protein